MKKILPCLIVFLASSNLFATHGFRNSASNINSGILPNERLDASSATLQGNSFNQSNRLIRGDVNVHVSTPMSVSNRFAVGSIVTSTQSPILKLTSTTHDNSDTVADFIHLFNGGFSAGQDKWSIRGRASQVNANTLDLFIAPINASNAPTANLLYLESVTGNVGIGVSQDQAPTSRLEVKGGSVTINQTSAGQGGLAITGKAGSAENLLVVSTGTKILFNVTSTAIVCGVDLARQGSVYNNPDYVFEPDYKLAGLDELQLFTQKNKHLPGMKSTEQVERDGVNAFEQIHALQEKLEEAYLYIFQLNERLKALETK